MAETLLLEDVLANARERVTMLRMEGHAHQALSIERVLDEVRTAPDMRQYLEWLDEPDAALYSGRAVATLARHFVSLEKRFLARWHNGRRQYRRQALEHRGNPEAAKRRGAEVAQSA